MIKTGIDIVEIERIKDAEKEHSNFLTRIFSKNEIEFLKTICFKTETIAGMFAAKEAFSKFLGLGIRGFSFSDIEVFHNSYGKPYIVFKGTKSCADLSISHSKTTAIAVVCGEEEDVIKFDTIKKMKTILPERKADSNKGDFGRLLILGGAKGMTGAVCLSAMAAAKSGVGLITVGTPSSERIIVASKLTEAMTVGFDNIDGDFSGKDVGYILKYIDKFDSIAFGMGFGKSLGASKITNAIINEISIPKVIDADGINAISKNIDILKNLKAKAIITPHPGEMSRLINKPVSEIQNNREKICREFAEKYNIITVLKGKNTVIASPDGRCEINQTGNSGLATGGTGDALSGIIASFVCQGINVFEAAVLGTYIHGRAGDIAKEKLSEYGVTASDVVNYLPFAIKELLN